MDAMNEPSEDIWLCSIEGKPFDGVLPYLVKQDALLPIGDCPADAPKAAQRFFAETDLIAFNDPNDLMSYPVPDLFAERYIDSRLCPDMTSVTINIAEVSSVLGLGEAANPLTSYSRYDGDERVGALIARGAGNPDAVPVVTQRCTFRATAEDLMK